MATNQSNQNLTVQVAIELPGKFFGDQLSRNRVRSCNPTSFGTVWACQTVRRSALVRRKEHMACGR